MEKCFYSIGRWVSMLNRQFQIFMNRELRSYDLKSSEFLYILELYDIEDGKSQDELAKILHLDKAAVARSVASLEKKGYVYRLQDKENYKVKRVILTQKSREFLPTLRRILDRWDDKVKAFSGEKEYKNSVDTLSKMVTGILEDNKD